MPKLLKLTPAEKAERAKAIYTELKRIGVGSSVLLSLKGGKKKYIKEVLKLLPSTDRLRDAVPSLDEKSFCQKPDPENAGDHSPSVGAFARTVDKVLSLTGRTSSGSGHFEMSEKQVPTLQFTTDEFYRETNNGPKRDTDKGRAAHTFYTTLREAQGVGEKEEGEGEGEGEEEGEGEGEGEEKEGVIPNTEILLDKTLSAYSGYRSDTRIERSLNHRLKAEQLENLKAEPQTLSNQVKINTLGDAVQNEEEKREIPLPPSYRVRVHDGRGKTTLDRGNNKPNVPRESDEPTIITPNEKTVRKHGNGVTPFIAQAMINIWYRTELKRLTLKRESEGTGTQATEVKSLWDTPKPIPTLDNNPIDNISNVMAISDTNGFSQQQPPTLTQGSSNFDSSAPASSTDHTPMDI